MNVIKSIENRDTELKIGDYVKVVKVFNASKYNHREKYIGEILRVDRMSSDCEYASCRRSDGCSLTDKKRSITGTPIRKLSIITDYGDGEIDERMLTGICSCYCRMVKVNREEV